MKKVFLIMATVALVLFAIFYLSVLYFAIKETNEKVAMEAHNINVIGKMRNVEVVDKSYGNFMGVEAYSIKIKDADKRSDMASIEYSVSESIYLAYCIGDTVSANKLLHANKKEKELSPWWGLLIMLLIIIIGLAVFGLNNN